MADFWWFFFLSNWNKTFIGFKKLISEDESFLTWFNCFQVVVPKAKGEILGLVIVESGWGSMLPTIVLANLAPGGPAARCGQLNIGDQVMEVLLIL